MIRKPPKRYWWNQSLQTSKRIQKDELKDFLGFVGARVGGNMPVLEARLADDVDMDSFFGEGYP